MPDEAILKIKQVNDLSLSVDKAWQGNSNVYLELYRALVTSGMLADISGNALKALVAMGLRARVLGGNTDGESLFRHLIGLKLVAEADRGKLFCYATQEDLIADCGFGSNHTLIQAVQCLTDRQLIEKRSRHRQRRQDASSYVANVYLIRPASSIRKFNAGYDPLGEQRPQIDQASHVRVQKMHSQIHTAGMHKVHSQGVAGVQKMHSPTCGSAKSALNKKEEEGGEEERISFILSRFAARKLDPAYHPGTQERRKVQGLLCEGYSVEQILAGIDQAFDARPANAKPVRGLGFIVSYAHRHLLPIEATTGTPTETLTGDSIPTGASTGVSTEKPPEANQQPEPDDEDPLDRIDSLLHAASIQGLEGVADVRYDLPGIRLGLRQLPHGPTSFSPDEIYHAVLAAVSRSIQPERLIGYVRAVLENARAEAHERERLHEAAAETIHVGHNGGEMRPAIPSRLQETQTGTPQEQDARYPPPDKHALALWQSALSELALQMTKATFTTWLRPTTLLAWEPTRGDGSGNSSTRVVLGVPNGYVKDWLENRLLTPIQRTLSGIAGQPVEIAFQIDDTQEQPR